jgi:hypothetical protein
MITVIVYSVENKKEIERTISFDGKKLIPSDNSDVLKMILSESIYVPLGGGTFGQIDPKKDPAEFIKGLYLQYKSYALRVSAAKEI